MPKKWAYLLVYSDGGGVEPAASDKGKSGADASMFGSKEEYNAYKKQFSNTTTYGHLLIFFGPIAQMAS